MADIVETIAAAIRDRVATETSQAAITTLVGEKQRHKHKAPPLVVWVPQQSPLERNARRTAGTNQAEIAIDLAKFEIHIWQTSFENCRISMHNIVAAARHLYGPNVVKFTGYTPENGESHGYGNNGELFILDTELMISVSDTISPTVTVDGFSGDVIAELPGGDEVVGSLAQ